MLACSRYNGFAVVSVISYLSSHDLGCVDLLLNVIAFPRNWYIAACVTLVECKVLNIVCCDFLGLGGIYLSGGMICGFFVWLCWHMCLLQYNFNWNFGVQICDELIIIQWLEVNRSVCTHFLLMDERLNFDVWYWWCINGLYGRYQFIVPPLMCVILCCNSCCRCLIKNWRQIFQCFVVQRD